MSAAPELVSFSKEEIMETLNSIRHPVSVAVWGSDNEFNIGGIIRTSHNFLVRRIHLIECSWFYKKGALATLKYEKPGLQKWNTLEDFLSNNTDPIVALERRETIKSEDIRTFIYPKNSVLFFGSEKTGVPNEVLKVASAVVSIPVFGLINDYNLTVACGITLYDWITKNQ